MQQTLAQVAQGAFKFALQMLNQAADAEDVLQDAVSVAISHKEAPSTNSHDFKPWFYKVVRNKSIDRLREKNRKQGEQWDETDTSELQVYPNPEQVLQTEQLNQQLQRALQALPANQREIVLLKDYHQLSYLDIAELLDIPKGTVMSSLHRARLALQMLLTDLEKKS
jgi:RNA polymerase sigma-70 factor (ECF subfamily)